MENKQQIESLRKEVLRLMVEADLLIRGAKKRIATDLGFNYRELLMALSGYRNQPKSKKILERIRFYALQVIADKGV